MHRINHPQGAGEASPREFRQCRVHNLHAICYLEDCKDLAVLHKTCLRGDSITVPLHWIHEFTVAAFIDRVKGKALHALAFPQLARMTIIAITTESYNHLNR